MANRIDLRSKFLGGMGVSALGDAIGEIAFRWPDEADVRSEVARKRTLIYTDDTAMAIGLAESIIQVGDIDPQHLGDTFRANFWYETWRGYASGPPTIFTLVEKRAISYTEAAASLFGGQGSFGNGAAMRVAPVGLFFHDAPDLYEKARLSAFVTHAHPIGVDGAAVLAWAIAQAVKLDPREPFPFDDFAQGLADFGRTPEMQTKIALVRALIAEDVLPHDAARRLGRTLAMHESLPFGIVQK